MAIVLAFDPNRPKACRKPVQPQPDPRTLDLAWRLTRLERAGQSLLAIEDLLTIKERMAQ